jgi:hypothetical protein
MKPTGFYVEAQPFGPTPQQLLPESPTQFFVLSSDITFTFQKDDQDAVTGLILHEAAKYSKQEYFLASRDRNPDYRLTGPLLEPNRRKDPDTFPFAGVLVSRLSLSKGLRKCGLALRLWDFLC